MAGHRVHVSSAIALVLVGLLGRVASGANPAPNSTVNMTGVGGSYLMLPSGPSAYSRLQFGGNRYMRIQVRWRQIESALQGPQPPPALLPAPVSCGNPPYNAVPPDGTGRNWQELDQNICQAYAMGFSIMANVLGTPAWACAAGSGCSVTSKPSSSTYFQRFVQELAERHGDKIAAFALWNEPNLPDFWSGSAAEYRNLILIPGYNGLQGAKARLGISPAWAVAPNTFHKTGNLDVNPYLKDANGMVVVPIDVLGIHTYGSRSLQKQTIDQANTWCANSAICNRFWITEGGFTTYSGGNTYGATDGNPGAALNEVINHCFNRTWCWKYFIHHMTNWDSTLPTPACSSGTMDFGLTNCDSVAKVKNRFCTVQAGQWSAPTLPCPCTGAGVSCTGTP